MAIKHFIHKRSNRQWGLFFLLLAFTLVLTTVDFSRVTGGAISITLTHIPIIIATILLGLPEGIFLSICFGITTIIRALYFAPTLLDTLFQNPFVSLVPRLAIPIIVYYVWRGVQRLADDDTSSSLVICSGFTAIVGSIANTFFVLLSLLLIYPDELNIGDGFTATTVLITNLLGINIAIEICAAALITAVVIPPLQKYLGLQIDFQQGSIRKTFQKWLLLLITAIFFIFLMFFYNIQTVQDQAHAEKLLHEKSNDMAVALQTSQNLNQHNNLQIGSNGYVLIIKDGVIVSGPSEKLLGHKVSEFNIDVDKLPIEESFHATIKGVDNLCMIYPCDPYYIVSTLPDSETYAERNKLSILLLSGLLIMFLFMYAKISDLVQKSVVQRIQEVNISLKKIKEGDLDEKVSVYTNAEFRELSNGINSTVDALKKSMIEIETRNKKEIDIARTIQLSSLPTQTQFNILKKDVDIFGLTFPAKEIGGDFYDCYKIDEHQLVFLVADVSGKGISAAMFMMKAKTLLNDYTKQYIDLAEIFTLVNNELCRNNEADMFVTCWMGRLDLITNQLTFVNAGHNPPLVKHCNGDYEYLRVRPNFVLGGMSDIKYRQETIQLEQGASIFLYTDGVTEATNAENVLYGEERLQEILRQSSDLSAKDISELVKKDTDTFVGTAPQFDDITILAVHLHAHNRLMLTPDAQTVPTVTEYVEGILEKNDVSPKIMIKMNIAIDEICSNIVRYSGATFLMVQCQLVNDEIILTFADNGIPYSPLQQQEPDTTLPLEERIEGGLGIMMVRRFMDNMAYEYNDGKNILTLTKHI